MQRALQVDAEHERCAGDGDHQHVDTGDQPDPAVDLEQHSSHAREGRD